MCTYYELDEYFGGARHTVNFCSEMGQAKHVSGKNIFCSVNVYKSRGKRIFEIVHWPIELPPKQHRPTGPFGWHKRCSLARPSKGQCTVSKILSSLIFSLFIEQNIFFPETCFAYTITEPKFTVWTLKHKRAIFQCCNKMQSHITNVIRVRLHVYITLNLFYKQCL